MWKSRYWIAGACVLAGLLVIIWHNGPLHCRPGDPAAALGGGAFKIAGCQ